MTDLVCVRPDDLSDNCIIELLNEHLQKMHSLSPPENVHALEPSQLKQPNLTFFRADINQRFAGCGALLLLDADHGEIKSMKTHDDFLRHGVAKAVLAHIIEAAKFAGLTRLSLETGTADAFKPAHRLYQNAGFELSAPFGNYQADPHSIFMTLALD